MLALLVPMPVHAASDADAWMSARQVQQSHSTAIGEAALGLADGGSAREVHDLRRVVAGAVRAIDALEVHDCFRVWWSYVRSSYVLFDQALVGVETNDAAHAQAAVSASRYLTAMAAATGVDCPRDESMAMDESSLGPRGGHPLANEVRFAAGYKAEAKAAKAASGPGRPETPANGKTE